MIFQKLRTLLGMLAVSLFGILGLVGLPGAFSVPGMFGSIVSLHAADAVEIHFFYSTTCPHCSREKEFLNKLEQDESLSVIINRYEMSSLASQMRLQAIVEKFDGAERFLGSVPITFVGDEFFIGFDDENGVGADITRKVHEELGLPPDAKFEQKSERDGDGEIFRVPLLGEINSKDYSLPALAVVLGVLDGFNVCSLGALAMVIGLTMLLKKRSLIALYGGLFIVVTALVYGALIMAYYQVFMRLASFQSILTLTVGLLGVGGGLYFLHEFYKYRKYGPQCESSGLKIVASLSRWIKKRFETPGSVAILILSVMVFAAVLAIVEFPCSAGIPVTFAAVLADSGIESVSYIGYIGLFTFFYMIDELIVFSVAVWKMNVWMVSPKYLEWFVLAEALILLGIGVHYLLSFF